MIFRKHGVYSLEVKDQVLIVDATGPFNDELVMCYQNELETCIAQLETSCWGQIVTLHAQSLFTPEAEQSLINSLKHRKSRGLKASAVVSDSPYSLVRIQISRIYNQAGVAHDFFENEEHAFNWLIDCENRKCA